MKPFLLAVSACVGIVGCCSEPSAGPANLTPEARAQVGVALGPAELPPVPLLPETAPPVDKGSQEAAVRRVLAAYLNAAAGGDRVTQARLSVPGKAPARRSGEGLAGVAPDRVWLQGDRAFVASTQTVVQQPPGPQVGVLVFTLHYDDEAGWQVADIDFEDQAGLNDELARFLGAD